jgi:hypothetical protein
MRAVLGGSDTMWGVLADALSHYLADQRDALPLVFALADAQRLERMFSIASFCDVLVKRETRRTVMPVRRTR